MDITEFLVQTSTDELEKVRKTHTLARVGDVVFCEGKYALVLEIHHWPLNHARRKNALIRPDHIAVQIITNNGNRWWGYRN